MGGVWCIGRLDWLTAFHRSAAASTSLGLCTPSFRDTCGSWHRPPLRINLGQPRRDAFCGQQPRKPSVHEILNTLSTLLITTSCVRGLIDFKYKYEPRLYTTQTDTLFIPAQKTQLPLRSTPVACQKLPNHHNSSIRTHDCLSNIQSIGFAQYIHKREH